MIVRSAVFENIMTISVAINTIGLTLDYYGIGDEMQENLQTMNFVFTILFGVEMLSKIIGLGPLTYMRDKMNYLDGGVVLLSFIELIFVN
jgi:hypothetical protein